MTNSTKNLITEIRSESIPRHILPIIIFDQVQLSRQLLKIIFIFEFMQTSKYT